MAVSYSHLIQSDDGEWWWWHGTVWQNEAKQIRLVGIGGCAPLPISVWFAVTAALSTASIIIWLG